MTADWSPARVEQEIYNCSQRIAKGVMRTDAAYRLFLEADHAYDLAAAKARLAGEGSVQDRKDQAEIATEKERRERDAADAAYKLTASNMRAIQSELDALRSIGTSIRQAYSIAGRGES